LFLFAGFLSGRESGGFGDAGRAGAGSSSPTDGGVMVAGLAGLAAGEAVGRLGVCPMVFRIWTPSWVLFSGGWCFLFLAGFYLRIDVGQLRGWAFPRVVFGRNAITMYCLKHLRADFIRSSMQTHFGENVFKVFGAVSEPVITGEHDTLVSRSREPHHHFGAHSL
jgi:hypothetical protein